MKYLLGPIPAGLFVAMLVFAAIGVLMALLIDAQSRDQSSKNTPHKFSFKFLLHDNWKTILLSVLAILISLRFAPLLFPDQFSNDDLATTFSQEKWLLGSFFIGLLYNSLLQWLKDKTAALKTR